MCGDTNTTYGCGAKIIPSCFSLKPEDDTTIAYSGKEKGKKELGVAIILRGEPRKALDAYTPVSDRIIAERLKAKPKPMTIIQVYAPTSLHDEEP